ncbi:hypothetical protein C0Q70_03215 [Pomacea canaliculata]|uniref:C-type lectin domain-containing protein n=1 Tax=Pomacea canaliculata TaxID=400727 RepID=A0A2T7PS78_POMCA|nr:hypothetical protein C0Q70_03215 [Pomacea canaliculata]
MKSEDKYRCTPAYRRFVLELGYTFIFSEGQHLYHVHGDKCKPESGLYWYPYLQFCFMISSQQATYSVAKQDCEAKGFRLAFLNTDLKYNMTRLRLLHFSDFSQRSYFIGAERGPGQNTWTWVDGSEVKNLDWAPGEPSNATENCIDLIFFGTFRMNDENCAYGLGHLLNFLSSANLLMLPLPRLQIPIKLVQVLVYTMALSPFMVFHLFLTDVALQGHPEMLDQSVYVTSPMTCAARCLSIDLCQAFFLKKSEDKYRCTPAYRRFVRQLGYTFIFSEGQHLYHVHGDRCKPDSGLYWYPYLQFCFMFSSQQATYNVAKQDCEAKGFRIVVLNTDLKYNMTRLRILHFSDLNQRSYFIGAERSPGQNNWTWVDGSAAKNLDWAPGQPSGVTENCIDLHLYRDFRINDQGCEYSLGYVCELPNP